MDQSVILVVEDNRNDQNKLTSILKSKAYPYLTANDGETAIKATATQSPDILLLDLGLPDMDGIEVIQKIRTWSHVPIIVISSRNGDEDKVQALDAGADDYLTKPYSENELLARIRVTQRRLKMLNTNHCVQSEFRNGELRIDYASCCVFIGKKEVHVTPIEFKLLCLFAQNVGKVLPHQYLIDHIWEERGKHDVASLRVFMANLRKKMEKEDLMSYLQTHVGVGYRMVNMDEK